MPIAEIYLGFCDTFARNDVSAVNLHALRKRKGWSTGRTGRFEKGMAPVNKGKRCAPGTGGRHPNAIRTQFQKGCLGGAAAKVRKPIGFERLSKEGYLERKINDDLPFQRRWRGVHIVRWEEIHGPMPKGHALKCLDGNKLNTDPSNWECLPRSVLVRLNSGPHGRRIAFDQVSPELKPTVLAMAKAKDAAHKRSTS